MLKSDLRKILYIGIILVVVFAVIFILVYFNIDHSLDVSIFRSINNINIPAFNTFFAELTTYGRAYFWVPVVALMWILGDAFKNEKAKRGALLLILVFIVIIIVGLTLKQVYYRPRPFLTLSNVHVLVPKDFDSSFPSGHALIVAAGAAIVIFFLRKRYSLLLVLEAALVCFSRVYVGVHYPSDVLAGIVLGVGISFIMYALISKSKLFDNLFKFVDSVYSGALRIVHLKK
ncbi:MAG: phosphoesterase PA-phosphatase related protein [Candidatus Parvarchaeum acidophilus ARMAN-5]|jgi:membrane-associated phospholipid phosphatase|uniref:Phosphoesterase PA-phosphatase related protein n=1 Tax=Candidatus Parvarchaeum acidophilus ARMAN-5 TaxID=662762 RepID=D6GV58_PARA5|nr:MAG: phosphoesterase PA-phosphatase related protein [Candidatus Parvarchaeum acidophilus ARMAN-5]